MSNSLQPNFFSLMCLILKNHETEKAMAIAREHDLGIGTILLAHGTSKQKIWRFLALDDVILECLIIAGPSIRVNALLDAIHESYEFDLPHHGVGFTAPLSSLRGVRGADEFMGIIDPEADMNGGNYMYEAIVTIVDRGQAELVVELGNEAGAQGGTILHGRGTARKAKKVFNMEINPEKEIVLTIVKREKTEEITQALVEGLGLKEPNSGILFTLGLEQAYGIS